MIRQIHGRSAEKESNDSAKHAVRGRSQVAS